MQGYFANVAKAYPRFKPTFDRTVAAGRPEIDVLRQQLYEARFQYWFRKVESIGPYWRQAKIDFKGVRTTLANPGELTYKQIGTGFVWGVHIVGAFCLGEIFGREAVGGYKVGDWYGSPLNEHH